MLLKAITAVAGWALRFLSVLLAVVAGYELVAADRSAPYFHAYVNVCPDVDGELGLLHPIGPLLAQNARSVVYVDLVLAAPCELPETHTLEEEGGAAFTSLTWSTADITLSVSGVAPYPDVQARFDMKRLEAQPISSTGETGTHDGGTRVRGLFFVSGEIDAGLYFFEMLPVPLSDSALDKMICSESLALADGKLEWIESYIRSCVFEQPWDPWGWASRD
jgi:hypothetical protein